MIGTMTIPDAHTRTAERAVQLAKSAFGHSIF